LSSHFVYLALTSDGRYYCGYAVDPPARVAVHNAGRGSKILRGKRPVRLVYSRRFVTKGDALRYESALKATNHDHKRVLAKRWLSRRGIR
jgi:putative endonuclease